jgi:hypothetical protein
LASLPMQYGPKDVTLAADKAFDLLRWRAKDTKASYATRATLTVAGAVLHAWPTVEMEKYRVAIPITENWILYLLGAIHPELRAYIFWDPRKEIERGIGLCGSVSSALVGILREHGIDARIVGLTGHVVVTAQVEDDAWYILDPDVGLVIPSSLSEVENDPSMVRRAYENAFLETGLPESEREWHVNMITGFYASSNSHSVDPTGRLGYYSGLASPPDWYGQREDLSYKLKWPVPFLLILLGGAFGFF